MWRRRGGREGKIRIRMNRIKNKTERIEEMKIRIKEERRTKGNRKGNVS